MMSLLSLRASSNEDSRLILRRKDSNCFMSVRIVIVVSVVEGGASGKPAFGRGIWASRICRTLEISRLYSRKVKPLRRARAHGRATGRTVDG